MKFKATIKHSFNHCPIVSNTYIACYIMTNLLIFVLQVDPGDVVMVSILLGHGSCIVDEKAGQTIGIDCTTQVASP